MPRIIERTLPDERTRALQRRANAEKNALRCMRAVLVGFFLRSWRKKFSSYKEPVVRLKNLHHAPVIFIGETDSEFNDHIA
jgi:hypothetical protein